MAPITRMPSRPRLIRPLRSVMHSPRLTNRNGVLTRTAPPTPGAPAEAARPPPPAAPLHPSRSLGPEEREPAVEALAHEHRHEHDSLQDERGRIREVEAPLQHASARRDAADEHGDRHDGEG